MKIALIGYGKMGKMIEQISLANGDLIVAKFSRDLGMPHQRPEDLASADVAIDFSTATAVLPHLELCLSLKKPIVIGTTGWDGDLLTAQQMVALAGGSCLYSPNFSIGVYLFQQILSYAAALFQPFNEYDVSGIELHHNQKIDKPSGTAKALTATLIQQMPRLQNFDFSSIRSGHFAGTHTLHFDSPADTLSFTHTARNREGFAYGAWKAAQWLLPKKGFFTLDEMMKNLLQNQGTPCN